uniref:F-box domain-containing protein n=1 Tax=Rhizophagus irregularis (strain DAOM 181602 / DAOM 197198 / MUCL 43194) TaxID=747089 RepID=U9ULJ8_RHIID
MEKLSIEGLTYIFNELRTDNKSLYSCLLINKEWCRLVVPILWERYPYSNCEESQEKYCNTILSCLPTSSKQLLIDNYISLPSTILSEPLTFNYVGFCKFLSNDIIDKIMNFVFEGQALNVNFSKNYLLSQEIYKLFIRQCEEASTKCFSQLHDLYIDLSYVTSNNINDMAQICKNLNVLYVDCYSQGIPGLTSLINAQRNLKEIILKFRTKERLSICYKLKSYEGIEEFKKYLANTIFPDLRSLIINDDSSCFKELAMLIEKTKGNISDVSIKTLDISVENTGMLLKAISNHCPKIEQLTTHLGPNDLIYVRSLLMNCKILVRLSLDSLGSCNENYGIGDELLDILTKFSLKTLTHITINGNLVYSIDAFEKFFESCRGRKLLYFNINGKRTIIEKYKDIFKKYYEEEDSSF